MGHTTALGYGEAAHAGLVSRRAAMTAHVTTNFFPALPAAYADVALSALGHLENAGLYMDFDAIEVRDADVWDTLIPLPLGIDPLPREAVDLGNGGYAVTVREATRILRLDGLIAAFAEDGESEW